MSKRLPKPKAVRKSKRPTSNLPEPDINLCVSPFLAGSQNYQDDGEAPPPKKKKTVLWGELWGDMCGEMPDTQYAIGSTVWVLDNEDEKPPAIFEGKVMKREKKPMKGCTAWSVELPQHANRVKYPYWVMFDNEDAARKGLRKLLQVMNAC